MSMRSKALLLAAVASLLAAASALATVTVYRNDFASSARVQELRKDGPGRCARSAAGGQLSITVGASTTACAFRSPVVGRNLQMAVTTGLLVATPRRLRTAVATGLALRSGEETSYGLAVYQGRKSWLLTRTTASGSTTIQRGRLDSIRSVGRPNRLSLRAFGASIVASINGKVVANHQDSSAAEVTGEDAAVLVFSTRSAKDAVASFDNVVIQVPDPK